MVALASIAIFAGAGGVAALSLLEDLRKAVQFLAIVQPFAPHE